VKERIIHLRGRPDRKARLPGERASDASKDAIVHALRQRVGALDDERRRLLIRIQQLEDRVEVLYGELYVKESMRPQHC